MNNLTRFLLIVFFSIILLSCSDGGNDTMQFRNTVYGGVVNGYNATRSVRYDEFGSAIDSTTYEHDPSTKTRTWTDYDENGAMIFSDVCRFNEFGRVIKCDSYSADGSHQFTDRYTLNDGLIVQRRRLNPDTDQLIGTIDFTYDNSNNVKTRTYSDVEADGTTSVTRTVSLIYDVNNRIMSGVETSEFSPQTVSTYEYNNEGQLIRKNSVVESDSTEFSLTWEYDQNGNVIRRTWEDSDGMTRTEYEYEKSPFTVTNHLLRILRFWI